MSERSAEDEIIAEARNFGRALMAMASQHGKAVSWMEQRRIRKEISRALRQQRQAEYLDRQKQLLHTAHAVDRYRTHAQAVTMRSHDPYVGEDRRARDQVALRSHATDLQQRILTGRGLNPVEQGIALDGIDSATAFPNVTPKRGLFAGAKRVKGINALRYRANVARARRELPQQQAELREQRRALNDRPRRQPVREVTEHDREAAAQQLRRAQLDWELNKATADQADLKEYQKAWWAASINAREVGLGDERTAYERNHAVENSRFTATVYSLPPGSTETEAIQSLHPNRQQAAEWAHRTVRSTNWVPQIALKAVVHERNSTDPVHVADGTYEQVSARTRSWATPRERAAEAPKAAPQPAPEADRLAEVEKQLKAMAEDRDRMTSRVSMLQRGFDSVSADRDDMRSKLDAAEGRIAELTNRNQRLATEIDEVRRDQPDVEDLRAERDRFKTERDEAVARLAKQTPPRDRFGSAERVAAETQRTAAAGHTAPDQSVKVTTWNQLSDENRIEMLTDIDNAWENTDSPLIRRQRESLGSDSLDDDGVAAKFCRWWANGGQRQYLVEQARQGQSAPSSETNGQAREQAQPTPKPNSQARNGRERSR